MGRLGGLFGVGLGLCLFLAACSGRDEGLLGELVLDAGNATTEEDAGTGPVDPAGPLDAGRMVMPRPVVDAGPGPSAHDVLIYAHSRDVLFTFNAMDFRVQQMGAFRLPDGGQAPNMLDLAVDSEGNIYTVSNSTLFSIDPMTVTATPVGDFGLGEERLYALTFLAAGELRTEETLIGATNEGAYYEVDPTNASTTYLGRYPEGWQSSGDLVSVEGLGTFATAKREDFPTDVLVRIRFAPSGASAVTVKGPVKNDQRGFKDLFGLGFWGSKLFGFSNAGELVEIDVTSGHGQLATMQTGTDQFWGAGVTTVAPVLF